MYAMTACHPSLPFGSIVRVVNRRNHRSVVVRITDRGDLVHEGRVIDLSYGAARKLGMTWNGLAQVDLAGPFAGKSTAAISEQSDSNWTAASPRAGRFCLPLLFVGARAIFSCLRACV